ncbi:MAG: tetratricopeptide repeat protein [Leptolyngbya sp. SIO1E4]|nr:tetratricopeptide repeat protein [Leptolyngbya sp. SIO1E4]
MQSPNFALHFAASSSQLLLIALVHQALTAQQPVNPSLDHCKILYIQGWQQQENGQSDAALATFQQLLIASQQLNQAALMQAALMAMQTILSELSEGRVNPAELAAIPEAVVDTAELARLLALADDFYHQNQLQPALNTYQQALREAAAAQDAVSIGICLNGIGLVHLCWQRYPRADTYFYAAANILAETAAAAGHATALHNWGIANYCRGYTATARDCFQQALDRWQAGQDPLGEALTLAYLGRTYARDREYWFALGSFEAAVDLFHEISDEVDVRGEAAALMAQIALVCEQTRHFDLAIAYYLEAYDLYQAIDAEPDVAIVLHQLGRLHERVGNVAIALHYYRQSLQIASQLSQNHERWQDIASTLPQPFKLSMLRGCAIPPAQCDEVSG